MNDAFATPEQIADWLKSIGKGEYAGTFAENQITFETLSELTDSDLKECGITAVGHRKEILAAIRELKRRGSSRSDHPGRLAHFEILEEIGHGGMGRIFCAWDLTLQRQVALKLLNSTLSESNPQFVRDFLNEARSLASLNHPHIVQIYFAGEDQGESFIVMELLEGQNMTKRLEKGPLDVQNILRIARQVAEALSAANGKRLIHGDIKPDNIFLTPKGDAKLVDFGLARKHDQVPSDDGFITGSVAYISPERARREREDFRSDIYSLGATLFEGLTGMIPFDAESPAELALKRLEQDPPRLLSIRPDIPSSLDNLVAHMMAREVDQRHPSYDALLADIDSVEKEDKPAPAAYEVPNKEVHSPLTTNSSHGFFYSKQFATISLGFTALLFLAVVFFGFKKIRSEKTSTDVQHSKSEEPNSKEVPSSPTPNSPFGSKVPYKIVNRETFKALSVVAGSIRVDQREYTEGANQKWTFLPLGNDEFLIQNTQTDQVLDVKEASSANGASLEVNARSGKPSQIWIVTKTNSGYYRITNRQSNKTLNVGAGSAGAKGGVELWEFGNWTSQHWKIIPCEDARSGAQASPPTKK